MRILFQGDSITDWGRNYADPHDLGNGYAKFTAALLKEQFPATDFEFIDLGISGNRAIDLKNRWQSDCIDWQPDLVSILIGINDTWRCFDSNDPTTAAQYEASYRAILEDLKAHTHAKIVILEPFVLHNSPDKDTWREDFNPKIDVARRLAREYADIFVPLDGLFAAASLQHEPAYWAADGVHPTEAGAQLIAAAYVQAITPLIKG